MLQEQSEQAKSLYLSFPKCWISRSSHQQWEMGIETISVKLLLQKATLGQFNRMTMNHISQFSQYQTLHLIWRRKSNSKVNELRKWKSWIRRQWFGREMNSWRMMRLGNRKERRRKRKHRTQSKDRTQRFRRHLWTRNHQAQNCKFRRREKD